MFDSRNSAKSVSLLPLPAPLPLFPTNRRRRWIEFKEDFYDYALSNAIYTVEPEIQISHFRTALGSQCKTRLRAMKVPQITVTKEEIEKGRVKNRPSQLLLATIQAWEIDYCGKDNILVNREKFYECTQGSLEPERFIQKVCDLADECEFLPVAKDEFIRDGLVFGLANAALRDKLISSERTDLHSVIASIRRSALRRANVDVAHDENVNKVRSEGFQKKNQNRPSESTARKCKFCDRKHPLFKKMCPARDQRCSQCQRVGHFAVCCETVRKLNRVEDSEDETTNSDQSNSADESEEGDVFMMSPTRFRNEKKRLIGKLHIRTKARDYAFTTQIDSGATVDVLPYDIYQKLQKRNIVPPLSDSTCKLKMYNGICSTPVGQVTTTLVNNGKTARVTFQVVDLPEQPLLGAKSSLALGCIKIGSNVEFVNRITNTRDGELRELLREFDEIFHGLGRLEGEVKIHLKESAIPVQCPPRRVPAALRSQIIDRIKQLEAQGIIAPVKEPTDWISQLLVVVRKDKKLRVTLDPVHLNKATKRAHYRLPVLSDVLPRLTKAKFFTVADASDGFFQCVLDPESTDLTTFWTPLGRYKYLRMPQGLNISPEIYQAKQMEALENLRGIEIIADDILIHGETFEDHLANLRAFFQRCKDRNLRLNKNKLRLCVPEAKYMGHILSSRGVQPDPEKLKTLQDCKPPKDKKSLLRFLGATNYLSRFIQNYSELTTPLRSLLKDGVDFCWLKAQPDAFEDIKAALASPPTLAFFDVSKPILIQTDASQNGVGAVLLQEGRPVDFCSSALRPAEANYAVIEKELLAIVVSCKKFDHYIFGHPEVTIQTDHQPLISCFNRALHVNPKRLQRMLLTLQKYNLNVKYVRGKSNCLAD